MDFKKVVQKIICKKKYGHKLPNFYFTVDGGLYNGKKTMALGQCPVCKTMVRVTVEPDPLENRYIHSIEEEE